MQIYCCRDRSVSQVRPFCWFLTHIEMQFTIGKINFQHNGVFHWAPDIYYGTREGKMVSNCVKI